MDDKSQDNSRDPVPTNYAMSGRVMLTSVIILLVVCVIVIFFHIYSRRTRLHRSRSQSYGFRLSDHRLAALNSDAVVVTVLSPQGLDPCILKSLPTFLHAAKDNKGPPLECAVCLSEFEDNEQGRILPKCNHSFHTECIDMWFQSHSSCPLCRAHVQRVEKPVQVVETQTALEFVVTVPETEGSERVTIRGPQAEENQMTHSSSSHSLNSSQLVDQRKPPELAGVNVETPATGEDQRVSVTAVVGSDDGGDHIKPRLLARFRR